MSQSTISRASLAYLGVRAPNPPNVTLNDRNPKNIPNNKDVKNFVIGDIWINILTQNVYILTSVANGIANWELIGAAHGDIDELTPDDGVVVFPNAGNVNIIGSITPTNPFINLHTTGAVANTLGVGLNGSIQLPATNNTQTQGVISIGGAPAIHFYGTNNSFFGENSGDFTLTVLNAVDNTGIGHASLGSLTTGDRNSTLGSFSGATITSGSNNTLVGYIAGASLTTASNNTAVGTNALNVCTKDSGNVAIGYDALAAYNSGIVQNSFNTALGEEALLQLVSGTGNIAIGSQSGAAYTTNETDNIIIGNNGTAGDNNKIIIGTNGNQTSCYIAGIDGVNVGNVVKVVTMAGGATDQLGTANITAGTNITVTPTANTIKISGAGSGVNWALSGASPINMVAGHGYIANQAGTVVFNLPAAAAIGDTFRITGINNATGWQIAQAAGQQIFIGTSNTTLGAGGSITSSATRDSIELICIAANTTFQAVSFIGNLTVV